MPKQGELEKRKMAAIMGAVFTYIKTNEEAAAMQAAGAAPTQMAGSFGPVQVPNLWGVSGRQAMMQANTMMQLRVFR